MTDAAPIAKDLALSIAPAKAEDAAPWDEFVDRHAEGRFCHLWGYKRALEAAYGYECVYLNVFSSDKRVGIFPSIVVRRGGGRLVSQPFNEYGGPLTRDLSAEELMRLPPLFLQAAEEENCQSVEIRGGIGCEPLTQSSYCVKHPLHFWAVLNLDAKEQLWRKSLTNEARKGVNKAQKAGLIAEIRRGAQAVADPFYRLYLISMKRLGVPPHSKRFFTQLSDGLRERLVAAWVMNHGEAVAVLLGAAAANRIQIFIIASDPKAWSMRPNDLAHWGFIEWAAKEGFRFFDFGSARYEGQIQFKKKWGVTLYNYCFYLIGRPGSATTTRIQTVETSSRLMVAMSNAWRWMVPTVVTRLLGPPIRKYLTK
jgi:CelD/BcsL family acetyltransferase involved in cellulose biosynthesis